MAEPQPSTTPPNHDADDLPPVVPTNAEDRKAAAALSSLDAHDEDEGKPNGKGPNNIDQEALGRAISRLEVSSGAKGAGGKEDEKAKAKGKEEAGKKIKVDQADVGLLVEELDLTKTKATDLLRAHEGDAVRAMSAYVKASA
ncbi:hypothetical protein MMC29_005275 [Sticta canariensis]|nr:hypothetical protein [Sticta canariensis]